MYSSGYPFELVADVLRRASAAAAAAAGSSYSSGVADPNELQELHVLAPESRRSTSPGVEVSSSRWRQARECSGEGACVACAFAPPRTA